ncbi:hypothetical protein Tsubulata_040896 [Turnera subulata]|uniref:Tetraspanin n=1 Tax=Turnera subulata TaxID=218843 RepID=A0A9Q0GBK2_9ROSI|nr:hypothetical protein Tsubulata_040896 [Turnera subulata]
MFKGKSNILVGLLCLVAALVSISVIWGGIKGGSTECEKLWNNTPSLVVGIFMLLVSLAGLIGAWCRVKWLMFLYLVCMIVLIIALCISTIYLSTATRKGAGRAIPGKKYKEYKLEDYSKWLQKKVSSEKTWKKMKDCLSGCCKPLNECGFTYVTPTTWTKTSTNSTNPDCVAWDNQPDVLCYSCNSCKAGVVHGVKKSLKLVIGVHIAVIVILTIINLFALCAYRNIKEENDQMNF